MIVLPPPVDQKPLYAITHRGLFSGINIRARGRSRRVIAQCDTSRTRAAADNAPSALSICHISTIIERIKLPVDQNITGKYHTPNAGTVRGWVMMPSREQELEDEVELLRQQLSALTGSSQEIGVLISLGYGMTHRLAQILHILVKRSPAIVSRNALHTVFYGDRDDGGPEPKIFAVHITRLRGIIKRWQEVYEPDGKVKIDTVWNTGYRASPDLVKWISHLYQQNIPKEK